MNILNIEHISKIYGEKVIFDDVSLGIHSGDKIGVIGVNGTGKTTLLKIIAKINEPDKGQIICGNGIRVSYLPQNPEFPKKQSILEYVMDGKEHQDWKTESEAKTILTKLGIYDFDEGCDHLSGGQKKRVALARTLVDPTEVLILDEPTNHLDNDMVLWLEEFLNSFRGVLIMVTHDRYFLDRVTNKIVEIDKGKLYEYDTNYSGFVELKVQREEMELATERKRQSLLRVEMEWMKQGIKARGTRQRARTERFEELKNAKGPSMQQNVEMDSISSRLGKTTIELEHISKGFGDKHLINDFSYIVLRDDRIGFIGPNGCGKSTLMKMIMGILKPDEGNITIGDTVKIGYFAQENEDMTGDIRVIDYIRNVAEYIQTTKGQASASQMLDRFLFPPELQYTPLDKLSGGEQRRLYLLKVLMEAPNVLILDEPTSSLDANEVRDLFAIMRKVRDSGVAILFVSHFLDQIYEITDRLTILRNGQFIKEVMTKDTPRDELIGMMIGKSAAELSQIGAKKARREITPGEKPIVDVKGLGKKGTINPVDVDIYKGEVVGFAGLLGSGRTELGRLLYGADKPDSGTYTLNGKKVNISDPYTALKNKIAYSTENRRDEGIIGDLTVRQNILIALQATRGMFKPIPKKEADAIVDKYMKELNVRPADPDRPVKNLSGGNQQKVLIGRWLATHPELLILDEPTRGIDIGAKAEIQQVVLDLASQGMGVVFISSELEEVVRLSDDIEVLKDRHKIAEIENDDTVSQATIVETIANTNVNTGKEA